MELKIKPLQAFSGDSILISFEDDKGTIRNILIDGGTGNTYSKNPKALKTEFKDIKINKEHIDLLVITHIDSDHIGGIIRMFEYEEENLDIIRKVWFNSGELISVFFGTDIDKTRECKVNLRSDNKLSVRQGMTLEKKLKDMDCWEQKVIYTGLGKVPFHGSKITILSPDKPGLEELNKKWEEEKPDVKLAGGHSDFKEPISKLKDKPFKEDKSIHNKSSISFLFEYHDKIEDRDKKILFLADSHPSVVAGSLKKLGYSPQKKLELDLVKVAHHSSRKNTSPELLELIECDKYLISTNGKSHGLPDKEAMARIIAANKKKTHIYFNYKLKEEDIFSPEDKNDFDFDVDYYINKEIKI